MKNFIDSIILGIVQGLTEYLPISSSGHLVIFQQILNFEDPEILFDIMLHVGTLMVLMIFYRKDIYDITKNFLISSKNIMAGNKSIYEVYRSSHDFKFAILIIIANIPTAIIGILFEDIFKMIFNDILYIVIALVVTAIILALSYFADPGKRSLNIYIALIIGCVQGIAIIPGISRSGITISTALLLGLDRNLASKFSFLVSIPAIVGAFVLSISDSELSKVFTITDYITGLISAFLTGLLALKFLIFVINSGKFYLFSVYCILLAAVTFFMIQ